LLREQAKRIQALGDVLCRFFHTKKTEKTAAKAARDVGEFRNVVIGK
jgi:hypothetical protein